MNNVNKTLYIPLYGKAFVSKKGIILHDEKAEAIWNMVSFPLKGKSRSKYLAYYMGMRAAVFDNWLKAQLEAYENAVVVHIGCGMDSRNERVGSLKHRWFDVDFPSVIRERQKYFSETENYHMLSADVREPGWTSALPSAKIGIAVMEGLSMYLTPTELKTLLSSLSGHFEHVNLLMDCYSTFAAKISKYKNPVNDVGVTKLYGISGAAEAAGGTHLNFIKEHSMTPDSLTAELSGIEKTVFNCLYAGNFSKNLYRLYEFSK